MPKWPHPLAGNHLAQVWQVGEGVSPTLDANPEFVFFSTEVESRSSPGGRPTSFLQKTVQHTREASDVLSGIKVIGSLIAGIKVIGGLARVKVRKRG